ncbi:MAG: ABC-ATPase domain-containing protein [Anaerolineae bacterium]
MPRTDGDLRRLLHKIDGRGYPAYKDIRGSYRFPDFELRVDHVQGDPFAAPSRLRVRLPLEQAGFPETLDLATNRSRRIAWRDFLARTFVAACRKATERRGSGKSGLLAMPRPGQEILERSSVMLLDGYLEARFVAGLPAAGRRVLGRQAATMLCDDLPRIVRSALFYKNLHQQALEAHLNAAEAADALRQQLDEAGLVAFVADGSVLPRRSGVDERPLQGEGVVRFRSPESLRVTLTLPDAGQVSGMGLPRGVTLIVGGGYHGKSTLLSALERGVYNHIPGDGRERVVTHPTAVKIRAEDGRRVEGVDIRPFIAHLPGAAPASVRAFRTDNASGSTSQAANIIEALEAGSRVLLLDEDTCATNLMIRDARMQALVEKEGEPITPFIDRARQLHQERGVSSILVLGGSGDYFDVADTVIRMDAYLPRDVTAEARQVAAAYPTGRRAEIVGPLGPLQARIPLADSLDASKGRREVSIKSRGLKTILFGRHEIDLSAVEQLVDEGQLLAIGQALYLARQRAMDGRRTIPQVIRFVFEELAAGGLDALDRRQVGDTVMFRPQELAAALNRLRTLRVRNERPDGAI